MEIKNSKFVKSITNLADKPAGDVPEITFIGKSNVGKSSLINCLLGAKLAKTSATPGRTRLINYFSVNNDTLRFVDLPGYGFNKASKAIADSWNDMMSNFLLQNNNLTLAIFIVDIRHEPTALDQTTLQFLYNNGIPFLIVATKSDKIAKSKVYNNTSKIAKLLKVANANIVAFSSQNQTGKMILLEKIQNIINTQKENK